MIFGGENMAIEVFKRYELKYLIPWDEYMAFRERLLPYMNYDAYGGSDGTYNIISLYYESEEKDIYYETMNKLPFRQKLRLRVYDQADLTSNSFIEVKQKFKNVVNKRRTVIPLHEAYEILSNPYDTNLIEKVQASNPQILKEALT